MTRPLTGAAKRAHERRVLRDAHEREMAAALAKMSTHTPLAVVSHLLRAFVLQEVAR